MKSFHVLLLPGLMMFVVASLAGRAPAGAAPAGGTEGDRMFRAYFEAEAGRLAGQPVASIATAAEWESRRPALRRQLLEMLGLDPLPARTELQARVTGRLEQPDFIVEKLHFQAIPGLYVTANLYLPRGVHGPVPAIVYGCGHGAAETNGISLGNKVTYQHHGTWLARQGYVCLVLDTMQLGEIGGVHHGTYREGMWWWNSRGYTPAGVEAWTCVRALDYLETRPEVDRSRFGVTGRSGGGAYSWWLAAIDDRVRVAAPVAGITDLRNHVVDGTVEGHCDCMFCVNTYRWDYATVAALVAPRPLLICNTDKDTIFPLDGVVRLHREVRRIYDLMGAGDRLGLLITEGPHLDTPDLQVPVLRWFNRFLRGSDPAVPHAAPRVFAGPELRVFDGIPGDEITSHCHDSFTRVASDESPVDPARALEALELKTFGGWPASPPPLDVKVVDLGVAQGIRLTAVDFTSQHDIRLRLYAASPGALSSGRGLRLRVLDSAAWERQRDRWQPGFGAVLGGNPGGGAEEEAFREWARALRRAREVEVVMLPRGIGATAPSSEPTHVTQLRRRFQLLGQTLAGMQAWDVRCAVRVMRGVRGLAGVPCTLEAAPEMSEIATFAALYEPGVSSLVIPNAPRSDHEAPDFLNWSRIVTPRQLLALAQSRCRVVVTGGTTTGQGR